MERAFNVLFLCTGNSARSILAEALLNHWGKGRFRAFSAGSHPRGEVNPLSLDVLRAAGLPSQGYRSKSRSEFAAASSPVMDFVFTVCDDAAGEVCPIWPGSPLTAHWGAPDPAAVLGPEPVRRKAFRDAFLTLEARIKLFTSLRLEALERMAIKRRIDEIGRGATVEA